MENKKNMKKNTKDLLVTTIKSYLESSQDELNEAIAMEDYGTARDRAEDIRDYCNCLDQFEDVEDIEYMTNEEFSTFFSTFESWQFVKEWLKEPNDWENDIRLLAEQKDLTDAIDEVIALVED